MTKVEFGESDNEESYYAIRIGIAPPTAEWVAQLDWKKYLFAASLLGAPDPPRIEIFNAVPIMRSNREESDGLSDDPRNDPFARPKPDKGPHLPGARLPFAQRKSAATIEEVFGRPPSRRSEQDPFGDGAPAHESSSGDSVHSIERVKANLEQLQAKLDELEQKATDVIKRYRRSDGDEQAEARAELTRVLHQQFEAKQQIHALEIELMRIKLDATEALLQSREKRRDAAVRERLETLLK